MWKPPIVVSTNITVWRGETANITLRGFQGNNPVEYRIDRSPRHGTLSPIRQPDPDRVSISTEGFLTYTHDDTDGHTADEFTFRARAVRGDGLSAPGSVTISVRDREPVLAAPAVMEFEAIAGEVDVQEISMTNIGGGILHGELQVPEPFELAGDGTFSLPRGESTNMLIAYAPREAGRADRETLQPGVNDPTGARLVLLGQSHAPFTVEAASTEMTLDGLVREATVSVRNLSRWPQEIRSSVEPAVPWEAETEFVLAAGASTNLVLRIPAEGKSGRLEVTAAFTTPHHQENIVLMAPAVPADLQVLTPELDFRTTREGVLQVTNSGGVTGHFSMQAAPGLQLDNGRSVDTLTFPVEPDTIEEVPLRLDVRAGQTPPTGVTVLLPTEQTAWVDIQTPPPPEPKDPVLSTRPPPTPPPKIDHPWQLNQDVTLVSGEGQAKELRWRTTQPGWRDPHLEVRVEDGAFARYVPPAEPSGIFQRLGDSLSGFFRGLIPAPPPTDLGQEEAPPEEWAAQVLDPADAGNPDLTWQLTALAVDAGQRRMAAPIFLVDVERNRLAKAPEQSPSPVAAADPAMPATTPSPVRPGSAPITPVIEFEDARQEVGRHHATVRLTFPVDEGADDYRLEHGVTQWQVDPETNIPHSPRFVPTAGPGDGRILGVGGAQHEGKELTVVVVRVDDLPANSQSLWRLVTTAEGQDRWPTSEFIITTLPPRQIPWRAIGLGATLAAIIGLLYLRHHQRRLPQ